MLKPSDHFHGSDLEQIEAVYGVKKEEIVSFSANVNPLGLSAQFKSRLARQLDVITSYPDREYRSLRKAIGGYCGAEPAHIFVGNGSTELISLIVRLKRPKKALILGPTYSEYEREIKLSGGSCLYFPLQEAEDFAVDTDRLAVSLSDGADLLVLCNPNNPTSSIIDAAQMREILDACVRLGIFVMIDETYMEFAPDYEKATAVPLTASYGNLVILRGVSKFFAAPGLRLGYAVTGNEALLKSFSEKQNPWTVSSIADAAGKLLFTDTEHISQTRALINQERAAIVRALSEIDGIKFYTPHANFILVKLLNKNLTSDVLFDKAIRQGMMIRNCCTFPYLDHSYFRFCFMMPQDNARLLTCIQEYVNQ
ncbi:MAG: aminotransferase class I/II-fold pyridoxal phosphate-dependent enzyme [Lachnospiraceae bacterium]|nr:aminotransferase class I/II-fold pyridoxal phosphate-dependent enzyme [Lachnospiraceae bacterium]